MNAFAAITAGLVALMAVSQTGPAVPGAFIHPGSVSRDSARLSCLSLGDATFAPDVRPAEPCRPRTLRLLGRVNGMRWSSGEYDSRWVLAPGDTEEEREVVLFVQDDGSSSRLRPIWHYRYRPEELRSVTLALRALGSPPGHEGTMISVDECVNGTGGCSQSFMSYRDGQGKALVPQFVDSLRHRFPDAINHGFHLDLESMGFTASVYSPGDRNCCPARLAAGAVVFRGDTLRLTSLRLERVRGGPGGT